MAQKQILTISRQYGSGGRQIGMKLAERFGIPFYDKNFIEFAAQTSQVSKMLFEQPEQNWMHPVLWDILPGVAPDAPVSDSIFLAQRKAVRELAAKGPCVIVGRGAGEVLRDMSSVLNVFIYADMESRKNRAIKVYGDSSKQIEAHIIGIDKRRMSYYRFYTGVNGRNMENYHLCVDSSTLGIDGAVEVIAAAYEAKMRYEESD